jgi:DNA invertase Pin-like site-specific DNA recombinase
VSINEQIDTSTSSGQLMFSVIAAFAQFERNIISERVKSGLYRARSQGKILGKPKKEADSDWVWLLRRQQGLSIRDISKKT